MKSMVHSVYRDELNEEQYEVVCNANGPCLVLAGAGSGKTRTVTYRVAYLLEQGVDPNRILLLTFTNKAAREMMARITALSGKAAQGIWGGTFHHVANRLLRKYASVMGFPSHFTILDGEDAKDLMTAVIQSLGMGGGKAKQFPHAGMVFELVSFARNSRIPIDEVIDLKNPKLLPFSDALEEVMRRYQERKLQQGVMDFDDLLSYLLVFLQTPQGEHVARQFEHVLVDEYQDTNTIQGDIVKSFGRFTKNIIVVGDDAQSIYSFRAANIKNILDFPKQFGTPGKKGEAKVFKLETNYRSTPEILQLANVIIKENKNQHHKELKSVRTSFVKPALYPFDDQNQEAAFIVKEIIHRERTGTPLEQQAVLFRSTFHSQQLEMALARNNIPYDFRGGLKFFERAHVKDVLAFLRVISNPKEEISWLRLLSMQPGIGAATAGLLYQAVSSLQNVDDVVNMGLPAAVSNRAAVGWTQFQTLMRAVLAVKQRTAESLILSVLGSPYQDIMESKWPNWRERSQDIEQLALFARGEKELSVFLSELALEERMAIEREQRAEAHQEGKVVLTTIHQAKGLEWDVVYIINAAEGAFPNRKALKEEGGTEEERRLMYVAVTRARRELIITYPLTAAFDATNMNRSSSFFDNCSKDVLERMPYGALYRPRIPTHQSNEDDVIEIGNDGERSSDVDVPKVRKRNTFLPEIDEL